MNDHGPLQMADLLPLAPPPDQSMWSWAMISGLLLLISAILVRWRLNQDPLKRLLTGLKSGTLSPREVAHQLAKHRGLSQTQQSQLDQLRFAKPAPDKQIIEVLIRSVRNAR